jgi:cyclase
VLTRRIIPCLDVKDGRVVKGTSFVQLRDAGDPVELADYYYKAGADELVFLDITATPDGRQPMASVVERISEKVFMPLTVGGGLRTLEDIQRLLRAGADKVSLNTSAVLNPRLISEGADRFGSQCMVVAIDARKHEGAAPWWQVYVSSGQKPCGTGCRGLGQAGGGAGCGRDTAYQYGRRRAPDGYDLDLTRAISEAVNVPVIASGGAGSLEDLYTALAQGKADAVLAASIFHYGRHTVAEAKQYLSDRGIPVRL